MTPETNAPLAVFLSSNAAKDVTGQIFSARLNELFIFNQNRPIKSVHSSDGWDAKKIADRALPTFKSSLTLNERAEMFLAGILFKFPENHITLPYHLEHNQDLKL